MKLSYSSVASLPLVALLLSAPALAAPPALIPMQGVLHTVGGGPAVDGDYALTARLYTAATGGDAGWTEAHQAVKVQAGLFGLTLGGGIPGTPLPIALLGVEKELWLGIQVGADPELPRARLLSTPYALYASQAAVAEALIGKIGGAQIENATIDAQKVSFTWAGSKSKDGPADLALDLKCSGCVSLAEIAFDGDIDLGGNGLKAAQVVVGDLIAAGAAVAGEVSAESFVGDGSQLSGIIVPKGACPPGEAVTGIEPDGSLACAPALGPDGLPADGLDEVSNGLLTNQFVDAVTMVDIPIKDDWKAGTWVEMIVPDFGIAQKLTVTLDVENDDVSGLAFKLTDPNGDEYQLYDGGSAGKTLTLVLPAPDVPLKGDLTTWVGQNPKGLWRLFIADTKPLNNLIDGKVKAWRIEIQTMSNKKVEAAGKLLASGGLKLPVYDAEPEPCTAAALGTVWVDAVTKALKICNGKKYYALALALPDGSSDAPATTCDAIHQTYPELKTGNYWLDSDGAQGVTPPYQAWCDMDLIGGGWTLAMHVHPADGNVVSFTNTKFWQDNAEWGEYADHFTKDYKSPAAWTIVANNVLIQVAEPGDGGKIIGWKAWQMTAKTFDSFFHASDNATQTTGVLGKNSDAVYGYEALVKNGDQLVANRNINSSNDRVRLGANGYPQQGNDNQPGLGTQMNEGSCGVGSNCYRYKDVELWVASNSNLWCTKPGAGSYAWIGSDGGCGSSCGSCESTAGPGYSPYWTYRIFVR